MNRRLYYVCPYCQLAIEAPISDDVMELFNEHIDAHIKEKINK